MKNEWPDGVRCAMDQSRHREWNATCYPGTRQLCSVCNEPTGRCEDDSLKDADDNVLCESCKIEESK